MNISNLNELLNTKIINEGKVLSVEGFSLSLNEVKYAYAFFSNDENAIEEAIKKGAFVIIYEKEIPILDKEIFYLQSSNLETSIFRLLRFVCEEKECEFLLCNPNEIHFSKIFHLKNLQENIFLDFNSLIKADKNEIFCCGNENYILKLCANFIKLHKADFQLLESSSPFYSNLICENIYFKNLKLPFIYAQTFADFILFLQEKKHNIRFNLNKLDFFQIYFIYHNFTIAEFGKSDKALIFVFNENDFEFFRENFKNIKGFKCALKNSLFCDFSYSHIFDLKNKDFKYCLILDKDRRYIKDLYLQDQIEESNLFN
ncbi:hypothetical protein [Campylobacter sp. TTU_617]|uniref:hypothetical protein n=1 Tax=Campylobacter sp. TTU_617 TaxID=2768148 RepID=UPI001904307F|nr:hypothetical protein [Campylobacter sp. TTU_617]MBK1971503.1 hypothetical protein [Campylobacter sp. TTU_617]